MPVLFIIFYLLKIKKTFQQLDTPNKVKRSKVFIKKGILKLNDWKNNCDKWLEKGYVCGDTIEKTGILREFSLSQFTYQTIEQYLAIEKEVQRNKRRYNQSYEGYFVNDDGTLDYETMISEIDLAIDFKLFLKYAAHHLPQSFTCLIGWHTPENYLKFIWKKQANLKQQRLLV